jgi:hypothetical protein
LIVAQKRRRGPVREQRKLFLNVILHLPPLAFELFIQGARFPDLGL